MLSNVDLSCCRSFSFFVRQEIEKWPFFDVLFPTTRMRQPSAYVHVPKIHEGQERAVIKRSWGGASIISVKEQRERETRR